MHAPSVCITVISCKPAACVGSLTMKSFRRLVVLSLSALVATGGCTFSQKMARPLSPAAIQEFDRKLNGREAEVEYTARGQGPVPVRLPGLIVHHPAAPYLQLMAPLGVAVIPWEDVRQIKIKSRGKGALDGVLIGGGAGLLLGVLAASGSSSGESNPDSMYAGKDMDFSGAIIIVTALLGAAVGAGIGALAGHDNVFVF
jgi:hypothetical protein